MTKEINTELLEAVLDAIQGDCDCCCDSEIRILVEGEEVEWTMDIAVSIMEAAMDELDNLFEVGLQNSKAGTELRELACLCSDVIDALLAIEEDVVEEEVADPVSMYEVWVDGLPTPMYVPADGYHHGPFVSFYEGSAERRTTVAEFPEHRVLSIILKS